MPSILQWWTLHIFGPSTSFRRDMTGTSFLAVLCSSILKECKGSSFEKEKRSAHLNDAQLKKKTSPSIGPNLYKRDISTLYIDLSFTKTKQLLHNMSKNKTSPTVWPCFYCWCFSKRHDFPWMTGIHEVSNRLADGFGGFRECNQLLRANGRTVTFRVVKNGF